MSENYEPYEPYAISCYGADYTVDMLVDRIKRGDICIPEFQRRYIWSFKKACRFIESLLLGLPVPAIFLSKEYGTNKLLVIDGHQRLRTLQYFYHGIFEPKNQIFKLKNVHKDFEGATYETLQEEDRRRLNDSIIHAIIVKQEKPPEDSSSIYYIFERLNTGGVVLTEQEIRSCINHGRFNDMLKDLNKNESWRALFGKPNPRMRDEELILRFFALYYWLDQYFTPMKDFLNKYMAKKRNLNETEKENMIRLFTRSLNFIHKVFGKKAFKPKRSFVAAIFDSLMVGITRRLEKGRIKDSVSFKRKYEELMKNPGYLLAITEHTTDEKNVKDRMDLATKAFADVN